MQTLTYKQAFDKITEAYIHHQLRPLDPRFCFCGTLCGSDGWYRRYSSYEDNYGALIMVTQLPFAGYTGKELGRMEYALLKHIWPFQSEIKDGKSTDQTEEAMFLGMSAALDVLRQIHIERGEVIDESPVFTKRQLA